MDLNLTQLDIIVSYRGKTYLSRIASNNMPPKKKKKKGGKKKGGKAKAAPSDSKNGAAPRGPASLQAESLLQRQSLEQQIAVLKARCESLRQHNDELKLKRAKGEKDTHEFVAYFQKELEKKDDRLADYREQLTQLQLQKVEEITSLTNNYESKLEILEEESSSMIEKLEMKLKMAEDELTLLNEFKEIKEIVEKKLAEKEKELQTCIRHNKLTLQQLERKFLEEKSKAKIAQEARIAEIKRLAREEAQKGLDSDTRKIVTDNRRMAEELRFQLKTTEELQRDKKIVEDENKKLKREVLMGVDKEQLYAQKSRGQVKNKRTLQTKVESLERSLSSVVRDFEKEKEIIITKSKSSIDELTLANGGLKQLLRLKNRELKNIRNLAQVILNQRTEVEQYFLDALEQVKDEIKKKKDDQHKLAISEYRNQMRRATKNKNVKFPAIRPSSHSAVGMNNNGLENILSNVESNGSRQSVGGGGGSMLLQGGPEAPNTKVDLRDLSWDDRERVLRLLFAKINNVQSQVENLNAQQSVMSQQNSQNSYVEESYNNSGGGGGGGGGNNNGGPQTSEGGINMGGNHDFISGFQGQPIGLDQFQARGEGAMQFSASGGRRSRGPGTTPSSSGMGSQGMGDADFSVMGVGQRSGGLV